MREKFDNFENFCLCGSGKSYDECCKLKINPFQDEVIYKIYMDEYDKKRRKYRHLCLHPKQVECSDIKTHAHTISQKAVLSLIANNGIVLMPIAFGITNEFKIYPIGIESKATKFHCFCQTHDSMFYPIDQRNVVLDERNFFLYAYRTFASTYYKVIRELECYEAQCLKYNMTINPKLRIFYLQIKNSLPSLDSYKDKFDSAILSDKYGCLESVTVNLEYRVFFAAATCFCPVFDVFGNPISYGDSDLPMLYISIIPDENQTRIIFSWFKEDQPIFDFFA